MPKREEDVLKPRYLSRTALNQPADRLGHSLPVHFPDAIDLRAIGMNTGARRCAARLSPGHDSHHHDTDRERVAALVRENVIAQLANLRTHPLVALALNQSRLRVHCWVYDIESGQIDALDGSSGEFVALSEHSDVTALRGRQDTS